MLTYRRRLASLHAAGCCYCRDKHALWEWHNLPWLQPPPSPVCGLISCGTCITTFIISFTNLNDSLSYWICSETRGSLKSALNFQFSLSERLRKLIDERESLLDQVISHKLRCCALTKRMMKTVKIQEAKNAPNTDYRTNKTLSFSMCCVLAEDFMLPPESFLLCISSGHETDDPRGLFHVANQAHLALRVFQIPACSHLNLCHDYFWKNTSD